MISCHQTLVIGDTNAKIEDEGDSIGGKLQEEMIERLDLQLINDTEICKGRWTHIPGKTKIQIGLCWGPMLLPVRMLNIAHKMDGD